LVANAANLAAILPATLERQVILGEPKGMLFDAVGRDDAEDSGEPLGSARVDPGNPRGGNARPQGPPVGHPWQHEVVNVFGAPRDLVEPVAPGRGLADDAEGHGRLPPSATGPGWLMLSV